MTPDKDAEDFFLRGDLYPEENGSVRTKPCSSCAFLNSQETVRPADVSLADLEAMTEDWDGFYCHHLDEQGRAYECAGWYARFGAKQRAVVEAIAQEVEA